MPVINPAIGRMVCWALLCFITTGAFAQSDWQLKKEEDGIKIFTGKTPNSNFKAVRVECTANARLSQLVAFLMDVDRQHDWVYSYKCSQMLKKIGTNEIIFYSELDLPWPCTNRDYISHITFTQPAPQMLNIEAHCEPDLLPEKDGKIRIRKSNAHWEVTALSAELIKIVYTVQFDPGGTLPAWLVNMFVTKGPIHTFQKLRENVSRPEYRDAHADFIRE